MRESDTCDILQLTEAETKNPIRSNENLFYP